jgi:hypothetical protein
MNNVDSCYRTEQTRYSRRFLYENYTNIVDFQNWRPTLVNSGKTTGADKTEGVLESIRKLKDEKPKSLMGQIRWMLPDIEAALDSGHNLTDIHARLNKHGIEIPYKQLSLYLGRIRRQEEKRPQRLRIAERSARHLSGKLTPPGGDDDGVSISPTSESVKLPRLKADPLANLKKVTKTDLKNFIGTAKREDLY